jgi:hypothetical protein
MKFVIEVGTRDKHQIEFVFNQLFGQSLLKVDGREVFKKKRWISEPVVDSYDMEISGPEHIHLRIVKQRKPLLGAKYSVYVDNRLTQVFQGV